MQGKCTAPVIGCPFANMLMSDMLDSSLQHNDLFHSQGSWTNGTSSSGVAYRGAPPQALGGPQSQTPLPAGAQLASTTSRAQQPPQLGTAQPATAFEMQPLQVKYFHGGCWWPMNFAALAAVCAGATCCAAVEACCSAIVPIASALTCACSNGVNLVKCNQAQCTEFRSYFWS